MFILCHILCQLPERGETKLGDNTIGFPKKQVYLEQPTSFKTIVCPAAISLEAKSWSQVSQVAVLSTTWR